MPKVMCFGFNSKFLIVHPTLLHVVKFSNTPLEKPKYVFLINDIDSFVKFEYWLMYFSRN